MGGGRAGSAPRDSAGASGDGGPTSCFSKGSNLGGGAISIVGVLILVPVREGATGFGLVLILEVVVYCESFKRVAVATSHGTNINMGARHYGCFDPPR